MRIQKQTGVSISRDQLNLYFFVMQSWVFRNIFLLTNSLFVSTLTFLLLEGCGFHFTSFRHLEQKYRSETKYLGHYIRFPIFQLYFLVSQRTFLHHGLRRKYFPSESFVKDVCFLRNNESCLTFCYFFHSIHFMLITECQFHFVSVYSLAASVLCCNLTRRLCGFSLVFANP